MRTPSLRFIRLAAILSFLAAISVELLQSIPQPVPFGHALGEIIRNLGYAFAAAYLFHFVMIELPQSERERHALKLCESAILTIVDAPASLARRLMKIDDTLGAGTARTRADVIMMLGSSTGVISFGGTPVSLSNCIETLRQLMAESLSEIEGQFPFLPPSLQQALMGVKHAASVELKAPNGSLIVDASSPRNLDDDVLGLVAILDASQEVALSLMKESPDRSIRKRLKPFARALVPLGKAGRS